LQQESPDLPFSEEKIQNNFSWIKTKYKAALQRCCLFLWASAGLRCSVLQGKIVDPLRGASFLGHFNLQFETSGTRHSNPAERNFEIRPGKITPESKIVLTNPCLIINGGLS
jgi:hypothetical protein